MKTINKILSILSLNEKKKITLLFILILCSAFIDMLGVASVMPFVALLTNPNMIFTNPALKYIYNISNNFGIISIEQFIFAFGISVFFLLLLSIAIRALTHYAQIRFTLMREYSLGKNLIENYLHQPYSWFLKRNSTDLGKTILSETGSVVNETILPLITLIAQSILSLLIIIKNENWNKTLDNE